MKKALFLLTALMLALSASAQKDVTKFLGIPVDGTKAQMIAKLKAKGFTPSTNPYFKDVLTGEFNGKDVNIHIVTNGDKVYRIMVIDKKNVSETDIKINFNNLCNQFENNKKYIALDNNKISEDEEIYYGMSLHNKRYEAAFIQKPDTNDSIVTKDIFANIRAELLKKYTEEQLDNPTDEIKEQIANAITEYSLNASSNKVVWFCITKSDIEYRKFSIAIYYDNEYNKAHGEDL